MSSIGPEIYQWAQRGACAGGDPDALFVQGAAQHRAKIVCMGCEVRTECLAEALDSQVEFGVWAAAQDRPTLALRHAAPDVRSWRSLLLTARDHHEAGEVIDLRVVASGHTVMAADRSPR